MKSIHSAFNSVLIYVGSLKIILVLSVKTVITAADTYPNKPNAMISLKNGKALDEVKKYYGKILKGSKDLKTTACCTDETVPEHHKPILASIDDEILTKFYGCGSPLPEFLEAKKILDLGCGTGRDVYLASKLAGPQGYVIGLDMTDEQLDVARKHIRPQMERFGYDEPNVDFRKGYIEDLSLAGIRDNSVDVVISNCVINLSPDKRSVYREIFRVLKPGGELYFSDVFADRRIPDELKKDPVLCGECLSGAMYTEDFRRLMAEAGCSDFRVVTGHEIEIEDADIKRKVGMIRFRSLTIRAFKLDSLEDICEDYGQVATYLGTIPEAPHRFILDDHHTFYTGKPMLVCGNSAAMVQNTRFAEHFGVDGDRSVHFGAFDCEPAPVSANETQGACC